VRKTIIVLDRIGDNIAILHASLNKCQKSLNGRTEHDRAATLRGSRHFDEIVKLGHYFSLSMVIDQTLNPSVATVADTAN
jgi:hypothetical protein